MKKYKGSFTIETALVFPIVLLCICITINAGIALFDEVCAEAKDQMEKRPLDLISCMYRREFVEDLFGEWYED